MQDYPDLSQFHTLMEIAASSIADADAAHTAARADADAAHTAAHAAAYLM